MFDENRNLCLLFIVYCSANIYEFQKESRLFCLFDFCFTFLSREAALGAPLDQYVRDFFPRDLIRLVRLRQRTGLIASRVEGLRHSDGDVVVFLDSHVEVNVAW